MVFVYLLLFFVSLLFLPVPRVSLYELVPVNEKRAPSVFVDSAVATIKGRTDSALGGNFRIAKNHVLLLVGKKTY